MTALPPAFFDASIFLFGLVVGSFLNVVVARLPLGQSVVTPRSRCPGCQSGIAWYDNLPVLSYLFLRGRCRGCGRPISARYPAIELLTGALFLAASRKFGASPLLFARDLPFVAILVAITFIDLEHRLIPDKLSLSGLALGLSTAWFDSRLEWHQPLVGAALGFGFFYALAWGYERFSGRAGLGGGDIKLLAMLGSFLGPAGVFTTVLVSSVLGSVLGIAWAVAQKRKGPAQADGQAGVMSIAIPYGPFLVIGALYYYLLSDVLWHPFMIPT